MGPNRAVSILGGRLQWVYYRDVLTRLPAMLPDASEEELLMLLPHLWEPV